MMPRILAVFLLLSGGVAAQITYERHLRTGDAPQNWLTYSGDYSSHRYSSLDQLNSANAGDLELKWVFQAQSLEKFGASPLVVDGVMYLTQANNHVVALDAKTGRVFWIYQYTSSPDLKLCCGSVNRGLAILGNTLFMGTLDAHLVALDARTGRPIWKVAVADGKAGYSLTMAPLVVKDKVIVGTAGGEYGIRGFIAAYEAASGKEAWRFTTIPGPGEPGHETWESDAWKTGGGSAWLTGSYDPELNLTYWGIGNPGPDWNPAQRPGDNLYTNSVVALDADTGARKWHFQFTPHDGADWDAVQVPVLVNADWNGSPRKLLYWANRNGFFYVFDRATGKFLLGRPFVKQNWATGLDDTGRPILASLPEGAPVFPGVQGGTNWYSPSYSPRTGLFYISAWDEYSSIFIRQPQQHVAGQRFMGGRARSATPPLRRGAINTWTEEAGHGAVLAVDPRTGDRKWAFTMHDVTDAGILTTAGDLLFTGGREGYFFALDARSGALLWKATVGGQVGAAPISYQVDRTQYVAIAAGNVLFAYALRQTPAPPQPAYDVPVVPRAPDSIKEGQVWIPPMPTMESVAPAAGWVTSGPDVPPMPLTLARLPRTNITRAKFPAIDFHLHAGGLNTKAAYERLIALMDTIGMGAIVNLNGGTGGNLDAVLKAGEPYRDRVATFITFNSNGINEPGWSQKFAAEMERAFKAGALGLKVSKALGQGAQNPDGTFIQADDPRLDPIWAMAARYNRPVMIHTGDSIGRFYPISPKNERYEAGLWRRPGDTSGNLHASGPRIEVIEQARENMHRKHPKTRFVNAHLAMLYYDPQKLAKFLDTYPNADVEISATVQDLGRAPRLWREFLIKYQDRVLMGSDGSPTRRPDDFWIPHWRYLETYDEYFPHPAQILTEGGSPGHGRWHISGVGLPDSVLRKIYYENALRHLPALRESIQRQLAARR